MSQTKPVDAETAMSRAEAMMLGIDGCATCPFSSTAESEQAQNYACLPTNHEILDMAERTERPWGCHGDEGRVCRGYASVAKNLGLPTRGEPISYHRWYREGEPPA